MGDGRTSKTPDTTATSAFSWLWVVYGYPKLSRAGMKVLSESQVAVVSGGVAGEAAEGLQVWMLDVGWGIEGGQRT